jgi:hypothetical protein
MNHEQENFEALQRLLKLKRYELPPPGYFADFSTQVTRRINLGCREDKPGLLEFLFVEAPWLQRIAEIFQTKPAVAWSFGLGVCALVISGVVYSETVETTPVSLMSAPNASMQASATVPMTLTESTDGKMTALIASTNPVVQPVMGSSLFDQFNGNPQPVSFPAH